MDRRRIALQIRAVRVTFRIEQPRGSEATMDSVRARARELLGALDDEVRAFPDLQAELAETRREVEGSTSA